MKHSAILLLLTISITFAQDTKPLAEEVLKASSFTENQKKAQGQFAGILKGALVSLFIELDEKGVMVLPERKKKLLQIIGDVPDSIYEDLDYNAQRKAVAGIYAESFTKEELTELKKFFETPTGKKFGALQFELNRKIGEVTLNLDKGAMRKALDERRRQLIQELGKLKKVEQDEEADAE